MELETPTKAIRWPVVRVQPQHDVAVVLLSGDWLRLVTHYVGRTVLCPDSASCTLCSLLPSRPYWYLPCLILPRRNRGLLELSATTSADLEQRARMLHGRVGSGLTVRLSRRSAKRPIYCEIVEDVSVVCSLELYEWVSAVMAVYGFPAMRRTEELAAYSARIQPSVIERAKVEALLLTAGESRRTKGRR